MIKGWVRSRDGWISLKRELQQNPNNQNCMIAELMSNIQCSCLRNSSSERKKQRSNNKEKGGGWIQGGNKKTHCTWMAVRRASLTCCWDSLKATVPMPSIGKEEPLLSFTDLTIFSSFSFSFFSPPPPPNHLWVVIVEKKKIPQTQRSMMEKNVAPLLQQT